MHELPPTSLLQPVGPESLCHLPMMSAKYYSKGHTYHPCV